MNFDTQIDVYNQPQNLSSAYRNCRKCYIHTTYNAVITLCYNNSINETADKCNFRLLFHACVPIMYIFRKDSTMINMPNESPYEPYTTCFALIAIESSNMSQIFCYLNNCEQTVWKGITQHCVRVMFESNLYLSIMYLVYSNELKHWIQFFLRTSGFGRTTKPFTGLQPNGLLCVLSDTVIRMANISTTGTILNLSNCIHWYCYQWIWIMK